MAHDIIIAIVSFMLGASVTFMYAGEVMIARTERRATPATTWPTLKPGECSCRDIAAEHKLKDHSPH